MKRRWKRGLALLLTLCLLGGNLAFAEELPETGEEPVIKEETVAEKEEAPGENAENANVEAEEREENAPVEDEQALEVSEENVPKPMRSARDTIYLNGQSGDDNNDGKSETAAVKSFSKAKELAETDTNITKIVVLGTTEIEGDITLEGTNAKILRGENFNKYVFKVPSGKTATLKDITIDGNSENNPNVTNSLIYAASKSTLNIQDKAVIKNNQIKAIENTATTGGGIRADNATLNMSGGIVEGNQATYGGGIYLSNSTMKFTGGTVQNNRSELVHDRDTQQYYSAGGGICADSGSTINMSDKAEVKSNFAHEIGGGISVGANQPSGRNILKMNGGLVEGNTSGATGAGIFIQAGLYPSVLSEAYISAGKIINNHMLGNGETQFLFGGGGIYVNGLQKNWEWQSHKYPGGNAKLYLSNALIYNNQANGTIKYLYPDGVKRADEGSGGGYAACPISNTKIHVTNGVAIYNNTARSKGNDLYILAHAQLSIHSGNPTYELSEKMLGGALWDWKYDDNLNPNKKPFYGQPLPLAKYKGTIDNNGSMDDLSLKTDFNGSEWIHSLAKVIISGNISETRGGGIGSNGDVIFGTEGDTTKVTVEKQWDDEDDSKRPEKIQVQLLAKLKGDDKEYVVETRTVTATDEWKITFDNLPKFYHAQFDVQGGEFKPVGDGQEIIYSVKEAPVSGYESEVTGNPKDGFTITNKRKPEKPPTPSEKFIEIPVEKIWQDDRHEGKRPTEITVTLYADGVATEKTLVLSAANGWKGVFQNLPEKKDGKNITYTVKEVAVKGYESVLTGNQSDGFVLTNTYKPEKPPTPPTPPKPPIPAIPFVRIPRAGA